MTGSLRALLDESIDYAGLFPPARLPLAQAIRNYAQYRAHPEGWMLSHFVCPASRLAEMSSQGDDLFESGSASRFSVVGRGGRTADDFLSHLDADLEAINSLLAGHGERVAADVFEVQLPADIVERRERGALVGLLDSIASRVDASGAPVLTVFYEAPLPAEGRDRIAEVVGAIDQHSRRPTGKGGGASAGDHSRRQLRAGFKLRTGGVEASAFPTPEQVAFTITTCRVAGLFWKATAGLHQPIGRFDGSITSDASAGSGPSVGTWIHGFLNLLGAAVLASIHHLNEHQTRLVLEDDVLTHFVFDDDGFAWRDLRATTEQIAAARRASMVSFGSCSFEEPCEGLRALGLL